METRTIVFLSHSIYVEGVVSRLRQHPLDSEIHFIDPGDENYIDQVAMLQPGVVVIDAAESQNSQWCTLCDLLIAFPKITIVRLKAHEKDIQVITSSPYYVESVQDLIDLLGDNH